MPIVPPTRLEKIEFYENHLPPWQTNAEAIGLTAAQLAQLSAKTAAARVAWQAQQQAFEAARGATQDFYAAVSAMQKLGAECLRSIKYRAESTDNPNVYTLAQIPPPAPPAPAPPPGTPYKFTLGLLPTGALSIKWKCDNPSGTNGTIYEVERRTGQDPGPFTPIGSTGSRSFVDETLPAGPTRVEYQITAVRSTQRGTPALFTVYFGVGSQGQRTVTIREGTPLDAAFNVEIPAPRAETAARR